MINIEIPDPVEIPWWAWNLMGLVVWYFCAGIFARWLLSRGYFEHEKMDIFHPRPLYPSQTASKARSDAYTFWWCSVVTVPIVLTATTAIAVHRCASYVTPYTFRPLGWLLSGGLIPLKPPENI